MTEQEVMTTNLKKILDVVIMSRNLGFHKSGDAWKALEEMMQA